jgi:hypothetical protein
MASEQDASLGTQRKSPSAAPAPAQREFLFVDAAKAKSSRQGRKNARSFVMQKARRERPWSTSKHAAKQRRSPETASPATVGTPDLSHTPITATPSPPIAHTGAQYFPFSDRNNSTVAKLEICTDCQIFQCRQGQTLCPRCVLLQPPVPAEDLDNSLFDPFGTSSVDMNENVSGLVEHCESHSLNDSLKSCSRVAKVDATNRLKCSASVLVSSKRPHPPKRFCLYTHNVACFQCSVDALLQTDANVALVVTEMAPHAIAVDIRNKSDLMRSHWFGTALNNSGFMHSLLGTVALHKWYCGRGSVETIFHHRAQAIAAVNSAISNPDVNVGISDANIGAVFNLLTIEETLASPYFDRHRPADEQPNQRGMHLDGLRKMVQLRGGLMAISSNRILQAFILWCVCSLACTRQSQLG